MIQDLVNDFRPITDVCGLVSSYKLSTYDKGKNVLVPCRKRGDDRYERMDTTSIPRAKYTASGSLGLLLAHVKGIDGDQRV